MAFLSRKDQTSRVIAWKTQILAEFPHMSDNDAELFAIELVRSLLDGYEQAYKDIGMNTNAHPRVI